MATTDMAGRLQRWVRMTHMPVCRMAIAAAALVACTDPPVDLVVVVETPNVTVTQGESVTIDVHVLGLPPVDDGEVSLESDNPGLHGESALLPDGLGFSRLQLTADMGAAQGDAMVTVVARDGDATATGFARVLVRGLPGAADDTFGDHGSVTATFVPGAIAMLSDDRIAVAGTRDTRAVVHELAIDGSDAEFATAGDFQLRVGVRALVSELVVRADDSLVLGGAALSADQHLDSLVVQIAPDGTIDPAFTADNPIAADIGDYAGAVAEVARGKLVVAAVAGTDLVVYRLAATGALDPLFGTDGTTTVPIGPLIAIRGLVVQPDGKLVVAGDFDDDSSGVGRTVGFAVRLLASGAIDPSWGTDGTLQFAGLRDGDDRTTVTAVAAHRDGILLAGFTSGAADGFSYVMRLAADGTRDPAFGTGGVALESGIPYARNHRDLSVADDGAILVVGTDVDDGYLRRYQVDGTVDADFGLGGLQLIFGAGDLRHAAFTADDRLVYVTGSEPATIHRIWL